MHRHPTYPRLISTFIKILISTSHESCQSASRCRVFQVLKFERVKSNDRERGRGGGGIIQIVLRIKYRTSTGVAEEVRGNRQKGGERKNENQFSYEALLVVASVPGAHYSGPIEIYNCGSGFFSSGCVRRRSPTRSDR